MEKIVKVKDVVLGFLKEHKNRVLQILAVLIVIIAIIVLTSVLNKGNGGNNAGNSARMGIASSGGSWIYYVGVDDEGPNGIYKVKKNGKKTEKMVSGEYCYINVVGNYIYCADYEEESLVKMKTNGKDKETLEKNIDEGQIVVEGKYVYYSKDGDLYRIKTNGKDKGEKISKKSITYYQVVNNEIYYTYYNDGDRYIAKMKANGDDDTKLLKLEEGESCVGLQVKGNKIYYILRVMNDDYEYENTLYSMNKKGEKIEEVATFDEDSELYNMQEDAVYYVIYGDDSCELYSLKYSSGEEEKIAELSEECEGINVVDGWIFYVTEDDDGEYVMERITVKGKKEQTL